jgi:hypothetical protein
MIDSSAAPNKHSTENDENYQLLQDYSKIFQKLRSHIHCKNCKHTIKEFLLSLEL